MASSPSVAAGSLRGRAHGCLDLAQAGVALRFPRISRIHTDTPAAEADRLGAVMALIHHA
jgi:ATP-dependent DNA ligase